MQDGLKNELADLGRVCGAARVVLFGPRTRGDNQERSDIDLAIFGLLHSKESVFLDGIDAMPTLLRFDIVFISERTSPELLSEIQRDGVLIYKAT